MTKPTPLWFWSMAGDACRYPHCACAFLWCAGLPHPACPLTGHALALDPPPAMPRIGTEMTAEACAVPQSYESV
jgi:hypothetical protein